MTKSINETIILSDSTYERVLGMLTSPDKESVYIGVSIIEAVDMEENLPYILLLAKDCEKAKCEHNPFNKDIQEGDGPTNASSFNITLSGIIDKCRNDNKNINYNNMYKVIMSNQKSSSASVQFFLDKFAEALMVHLATWGFDFVDEMNLKLIPKNVKQS